MPLPSTLLFVPPFSAHQVPYKLFEMTVLPLALWLTQTSAQGRPIGSALPQSRPHRSSPHTLVPISAHPETLGELQRRQARLPFLIARILTRIEGWDRSIRDPTQPNSCEFHMTRCKHGAAAGSSSRGSSKLVPTGVSLCPPSRGSLFYLPLPWTIDALDLMVFSSVGWTQKQVSSLICDCLATTLGRIVDGIVAARL